MSALLRFLGVFGICLIPISSWADTPILTNGDFSVPSINDGSSGWQCVCSPASPKASASCSIKKAGGISGRNALVVPTGCTATDIFMIRDRSLGFRAELNVQGATIDRSQVTIAINSGEQGWDKGTVISSSNLDDSWRHLHLGTVSSNHPYGAGIVSILNRQTEDLLVDNVQVFQDNPNPESKVGTILHAIHRGVYDYLPGNDSVSLWVPLPMDYATQTVLSLDLKINPESVVKELSYRKDTLGNWGAIVALDPHSNAKGLAVAWDALVLSKTVTPSEKTTIYAAKGLSPDSWLVSTSAVESSDPSISNLSKSLTTDGSTDEDKMMAIISWTAKNLNVGKELNPNQQIRGLDATTVFQDRIASCTGYTNLAAAMGRSVGVPTHGLANLLVGMPQQTHSIDEFYLGADLGWRRVEPQAAQNFVAEDYAIPMRIILPSDEGPAAMSQGDWNIPGVPLYSMDQPIGAANRLVHSNDPEFPDCAECENWPEYYAALHGSMDKMNSLFDRVRELWKINQDYLLLVGGSSQASQQRANIEKVNSLEDLEMTLFGDGEIKRLEP